MKLASRREVLLALPPAEVWRRISVVDDYRTWWPWLREFAATGLVVGDRWTCTIRPPAPYTVRCTVDVTDVVPSRLVGADVDGDLAGHARLELRPAAAGTVATFSSELAARRRTVRVVAGLVPPIARWGHAWVLDAAARQFAEAVVADAADDAHGSLTPPYGPS